MSIPFSYPGAAAEGSPNTAFVITTGLGIYTVSTSGNLQIECWGKGGRGANGSPTNGGGGGGGGGYSKKSLAVTSGDVFGFQITAGGNALVTSGLYSLSMAANAGANASGTAGAAGGTASGGTTNHNGRAGLNASGSTGGKGGDTVGGTGGSGGTSGNNGQPGPSPGTGGGGGGANASGALGGTAQIVFTFI